MLSAMIRIARRLDSGETELYPAWQGMRNMLEGKARMTTLDNGRYPGLRWITAREVLAGAV